MMEEENIIRPHQEIRQLTLEEKKFLLAVERGDMAGTRRYSSFSSFSPFSIIKVISVALKNAAKSSGYGIH